MDKKTIKKPVGPVPKNPPIDTPVTPGNLPRNPNTPGPCPVNPNIIVATGKMEKAEKTISKRPKIKK